MKEIDPKCEGCGKRPEVYGSSWCAHCHDTLPRHIQERILELRNALIFYSVVLGQSKSMDYRIIHQDGGKKARVALRLTE